MARSYKLTQMGAKALRVKCAFCGALPGETCYGVDIRFAGWQNGIHIARLHAAFGPMCGDFGPPWTYLSEEEVEEARLLAKLWATP